jgi:hypothetical protein
MDRPTQLVSFGLLLLVAIGLVGCVEQPASQESDSLKPLPIDTIIERLSRCQGSSTWPDGERPFPCTYDISDENLAKLNLLKGLSGKEICTPSGSPPWSQTETCTQPLPDSLETEWTFSYEDVGVDRSCDGITLLKAPDSTYYITFSHNFHCSTQTVENTWKVSGLDPATVTQLKS